VSSSRVARDEPCIFMRDQRETSRGYQISITVEPIELIISLIDSA